MAITDKNLTELAQQMQIALGTPLNQSAVMPFDMDETGRKFLELYQKK